MKNIFFKRITKKAAIIMLVAAFFVILCFFLSIHFYTSHLERQLHDGIEIEKLIVSAEGADISFLHGTVSIKNLHIHKLNTAEKDILFIEDIHITGIPRFSLLRNSVFPLAQKVTLSGIKGRWIQHNISTSLAVKGISFGEILGNPRLLLSNEHNDFTPALTSLSFHSVWFFGVKGEHNGLDTLYNSIFSQQSELLKTSQERSSDEIDSKKNAQVGNSQADSLLLLFEKNNHLQSKKLSQKLLFEFLEKAGSHIAWNIEFTKIDSLSLINMDNASFSNIHVLSEKEELLSLASLGIKHLESPALKLGIPFSNLKELTFERLRFPNKKDGDISLAHAEITLSLLFTGVSLDFSCHELSFPKNVSPLSFERLYKSIGDRQETSKAMPAIRTMMSNSYARHTFDMSFHGALSLVERLIQEKKALFAWQADTFILHFSDLWTLSGKASGVFRDAIDDYIEVSSLDANLSDTIGNSLHRAITSPIILNQQLFYWLIMGDSTSEVYEE